MAVPVSLGRRQCTSHGGEIQLNNVGIAILSRKFRHVCLDKAKVLIKIWFNTSVEECLAFPYMPTWSLSTANGIHQQHINFCPLLQFPLSTR